MWDEIISKILIGVGEVMNSPGGGGCRTTVTLLVRIAIPLEAHPGQLELGCENMWPNHADKGHMETVILEMQDLSDIVSGGFWLIRHRLPRGLRACAVGLLAPDSLSTGVGRLMRLALELAELDLCLWPKEWFRDAIRHRRCRQQRVDLGACDGATDFDDVLIVQPFGVANEGPFFVHLLLPIAVT
ncbi:hypothetical protein C8J57DRAFT_1232248 [Mycena rebaudengoi]|nr:hypothetical protein C8J57DRAFT_1232248 [Mycena rebaudengoi]